MQPVPTKPCYGCGDEATHLLHRHHNPSPVWLCRACAKELQVLYNELPTVEQPTIEGPVRK